MLKKSYIFKLVSLFAAMVMTLLPLSASAETQNKDYGNLTIRFATQPSQPQIVLAEELGYFQEEFGSEKIRVDVRTFPSGPPIIEAFAAGQVDFGQVGAQPAIQAANNEISLKIIGAYMTGKDGGKGTGLFVRKDSGINSLKDIRGKKIGVQVGSVGHMTLLQYLKSQNLTVADIQLVNLSLADINTALASGSIDAGVSWFPQVDIVVRDGTAVQIADASQYPITPSVIIVSGKFAEKYPELIPPILKALDRAVTYCLDHEDDAISRLAARNSLEESGYRRSFESTDFSLYLDRVRIEGLRYTEKFLEEQGTIKGVDIDNIVDTSFLETAGISKK
jgi:sulfonate transport system substrate-binding protein